MSALLATLCINEMQWLEKLYEQHRDWPHVDCWVFVESADKAYAEANPDMVNGEGLSVDGTSEYLRWLANHDSRIVYIPFGYSRHHDLAKGKCEARQAYLDIAEQVKPEVVISVDADEFYTRDEQSRIVYCMRKKIKYSGFIFNRREIWYPPSLQEQGIPITSYEVVGGFWQIPCCHWWRWEPGMNHRFCHNTPYTADGKPLNKGLYDFRRITGSPEMIHFGFAAQRKEREAKNNYYAHRGESVDPRRSWYVHSRGLWSSWKPGDILPARAQVIPYTGPIPEVFQ